MMQQLVAADPTTVEVARMLAEAGWLSTASDVLDFFEKPHKHADLAAAWQTAGRPWPGDAGWEMHVRRLDAMS